MQSSKDKAIKITEVWSNGDNYCNEGLEELMAQAFDEYEAKLKIATKALEFYQDQMMNKIHTGDFAFNDYGSMAIQALEALKRDV